MISFSRLTLRQKLIGLIMLASALAFLCVTVAAVFFEVSTFQPRALESLKAEAAVLEEVLSGPLDFGFKDVAEKGLKKHCLKRPMVLAVLYDTNRLFTAYQRNSSAVQPPPAPARPTHEFRARRLSLWWPVHNNENILIGHLYLVEELPPFYARLPQYAIMTGAVFLALAVVGFVLMNGLGRNVLHPLAVLLETTTQVTRHNDYAIRAAVWREDELGQLAQAFNQMLETVRQRDAALRESEAFRRRVFDTSRVPIVVMDAATFRYLDCNPAAAQIYRFSSREDALGKTPLDVSAPVQYDGTPSPEKARFYIEKAGTDGTAVFEWRHQRPDGEIWDAEVHLMSFQSGQRQFLQFTLQDITERKRAVEALRESEAKLRAMFEASRDAIGVAKKGTHIYANPSYLKLFGFQNNEEIVGTSIINSIAPSHRSAHA